MLRCRCECLIRRCQKTRGSLARCPLGIYSAADGGRSKTLIRKCQKDFRMKIIFEEVRCPRVRSTDSTESTYNKRESRISAHWLGFNKVRIPQVLRKLRAGGTAESNIFQGRRGPQLTRFLTLLPACGAVAFAPRQLDFGQLEKDQATVPYLSHAVVI